MGVGHFANPSQTPTHLSARSTTSLGVWNIGAAARRSAPRPGSATRWLQKNRIRNHHPGGDAATVAGHVGPGFHTWPTGHIPQITTHVGHPLIQSPIPTKVGVPDSGVKTLTLRMWDTHSIAGRVGHVRHPLFRPQSRQKWVSQIQV